MRPIARLGVVLGLLVAAWAAIAFSPAVSERPAQPSVAWAPSVEGWISTEGAPEWALPVDPHQGTSVRRTYARGQDTAWVSVALFTGQNDPRRRAAINLIYPERNTVRIDRLSVILPVNGTPAGRLELSGRLIQRGAENHLLVVFWHQIGRRVYGSEYAYRLALTRDILFARRADVTLVRIAVPVPAGGRVDEALTLVRELAPPIRSAVSTAMGS